MILITKKDRTFTAHEVFNGEHVGWIMQYVKMSPFTNELSLDDGERVMWTEEIGGGMTISIES